MAVIRMAHDYLILVAKRSLRFMKVIILALEKRPRMDGRQIVVGEPIYLTLRTFFRSWRPRVESLYVHDAESLENRLAKKSFEDAENG